MKSRHIYILILILLIGGVFESFKRISFQKQVNNNNQQISANELKNLEIQPFYLNKNSDESDNSEFKYKKVRAIKSMKKSDFDFARTHTFSNAKPVKKEDNKKKTAKKEDKKKSNEKKETPKSVEPIKKVANEDYEDAPESPEALAEDNGPQGFPGVGNNANGEKIPESADEWTRIMLDYPSYKKVQEFIAHYLGQRVSPGVFYQVLTAMAEDPREEVNIYAVRAAGSTPSYQSFYFLTTVIAETTMPPKVNSLARTQLETYVNLQYLNTLKSVVVTKDYPFAQTLAATLIAKSARANLSKKSQNPTGDNLTPLAEDNNSALSAIVIKNYQQTKELLSDLLNIGKMDNSLTSALTDAIRAIDDSLEKKS